ncbi:subtilisin SUB7 [Cardiosporidium cionae]|uniref:subtilisin n=1 Tax=Cardiosporidium cionae TaxID=476202 RepID=A0ABQ7JF35_9APIC|nr:subtilisin SUB7 [Cardiosporidium cionae]|eukprot:KAF8822609.1 subtilisin SUB7 [Cardiosporidium cionae]
MRHKLRMVLGKYFITFFFTVYFLIIPLIAKAQRIVSDSSTSENTTKPTILTSSMINNWNGGSQSSILSLLTPFSSNLETYTNAVGTAYPFFGPHFIKKRSEIAPLISFEDGYSTLDSINTSFALWDPLFASFFNRLTDSKTIEEGNLMISHLSKPLLGKSSIIYELLETTNWIPSNTKRNVIISYKHFKPFLGVESLLQRTTFLKTIWDTIKIGLPIRSIYLKNIGMELMEVPDIFHVSEFVQILLSQSKIVDVFQDTEIGFSNVSRKLNLENALKEKERQETPLFGTQLGDDTFSTLKNQKKAENRHLFSKKSPNDANFNNQWAFIDSGSSKWGIEMQRAWDIWTGKKIYILTRVGSTFYAQKYRSKVCYHLFSLTAKSSKASAEVNKNILSNTYCFLFIFIVGENLPKKFIIALIDSGVDYNHPDLRENIWKNEAEICNNGIDDDNNGLVDDCLGWVTNDFVNNNNNPLDDNGHGTASAGILAATSNNGLGVAGMCWGCQLMVLKALNHEIKGTVSGFVRAIDYALEKGAKLSSNSYGGRGSEFSALHEAVLRAKQQGMIFVTAAGNYKDNNDNDKNPVYPASYDLDNIISVAAITRQGRLADFSSYGRNSVDVAAPGERIFSTFTGGDYRFVDGTSFAVPFVTGTAALIWSNNPTLPYREVISQIIQYQKVSPYLKELTRTSGVLNVWAALTKNGTSAVTAAYIPLCKEKNPCDANAICTDSSSGAQCQCKTGFNGNGVQCKDINECNYHPCGKVSTCYNKMGSFECRCISGFKRIDDFCEDVNECSTAGACPVEAKCANFAGTHDCFCPPGHFWNAKEGKDGRCLPLCKLLCDDIRGNKLHLKRFPYWITCHLYSLYLYKFSDSAQNRVCVQNGNCGINSICKPKRSFWFYTSSCECLPGYIRDAATQTCVRNGLLYLHTQAYIAAVPKPYYVFPGTNTTTANPSRSRLFGPSCFFGFCF